MSSQLLKGSGVAALAVLGFWAAGCAMCRLGGASVVLVAADEDTASDVLILNVAVDGLIESSEYKWYYTKHDLRNGPVPEALRNSSWQESVGSTGDNGDSHHALTLMPITRGDVTGRELGFKVAYECLSGAGVKEGTGVFSVPVSGVSSGRVDDIVFRSEWRSNIVTTIATCGKPLSGFGGDAHVELELYEFLLNDLFKDYAETNEVCYVSLSVCSDSERDRLNSERRAPPHAPQDVVDVEPPAAFFDRFKKRPYRVRPASERPEPKVKDSLLPLREDNPKTGRPDGIYSVTIIGWMSPTAVRVKCSMYRHGLWARGYEGEYEWKNGKWIRQGFPKCWVS